MITKPDIRAASRSLWRVLRPAAIAAAGLNAAIVSALLVAVYLVPYDASTLSPNTGGPLVVTDRDGNVLRAVASADGRPGREHWIALEQMPSHAILTVVASEDEGFYEHRGVDGAGILRAAWLDMREGRFGYGGSTITMQLARMIHSRGSRRSIGAKMRETVQALRMERAMTKGQILEQYLNRAYYGNGAYGIEAAAQTYFGKPAVSLSAAESTLLAIVPRSPSAYDPLRHLAVARRRRDYVLALLGKREQMSPDEIERARSQPLTPELHRPPNRARHFTDWVIAQLAADTHVRGGIVRTTLDLDLQQQLERRVEAHLQSLGDRNLNHAGAVILDTETSEVLALVGSRSYDDRNSGQLNIVTRRRHPGSALKPFIYALAIEDGDSPASIAWDVLGAPSAYRVIQLTQREHGPVRYREALAGSYNLAAVHTLEKVGVGSLMSTLRRAGVGPLDGTPRDYGLRLALGSAKVRLVDLAAAYGFVVREGRVRRPTAIIETRAASGAVHVAATPTETTLFTRETAWQVMDMLADSAARRGVFGTELPLDLPFPVAAKTGTSRGFADTVTVAATREVIVAAWAGNFDGEPTQGLVAMQSAAPIARAGLQLVAQRMPDHRLTLPAMPEQMIDVAICPVSGLRAGPHCAHRIHEEFAPGRAPEATCTWHRGDGTVRYPHDAYGWRARPALN